MPSERLQVILELITGNYKREAREAATATGQIGKSAQAATGPLGAMNTVWKNFAGPAAILGAGVAVARFAKDSIMAASDLEESVNAVNVVFGEAAEGIHALGEESVESFGLSRAALNEFAVRFSAFGENIAQSTGRDVADVVEEMTTRIADFGSVHNVTMEEAAVIAQSTLAGETEAFRRFGGDVSAAAVELKGLEMGLGRSSAELTEQEKILIRYQLFMEQTADTAGDFENTADSTANTMKRLNARFEETKARVGKALMPAMTALLEVTEDLGPTFEHMALEIAGVVKEVAPLVKGLGQIVGSLGTLREKGDEWQDSNNGLVASIGRFVDDISFLDVLTANYAAHMEDAADATAELEGQTKTAGPKTRELSAGLHDSWENAAFMADATENDLNPALFKLEDAAYRAERGLIEAKLAAQEAGRAFREDLAADYVAAAISIDKTSKEMIVSLDAIEARLLENLTDQAAFYENLIALAEAGYGDLAEFLRGQGADQVAGATADLVDDMGRAASLEDMIDQTELDAVDFSNRLALAMENQRARLVDVARSLGIDLAGGFADGLSTVDLQELLGIALGAPGLGPVQTGRTTAPGTGAAGYGGSEPRAWGGPISANQMYMVGERGPEMFVSGSSGSIIPNHALSRTVNISVASPTNNLAQDLQYAALLASVQTMVES